LQQEDAKSLKIRNRNAWRCFFAAVPDVDAMGIFRRGAAVADVDETTIEMNMK